MNMFKTAAITVLSKPLAIKTIEKAYNNYKWKKSFNSMFQVRHGVARFQSLWRAKKARYVVNLMRCDNAATIIQRNFRGRKGRRDIVLKGVLKRVMCRRIARWIITRRNKRQARMNWKWIFANKGWLLEVMTVYQVEAGVLALDGSRKSCLELRRLFHTSMSSYWQPVLLRTGPHGLAMQRCQVVRLYMRWSKEIRALYLKYSIKGVSAPDRAFRINRMQFMAFAKECNFYDILKQNNTLDRLFQLCSRKMLFKTKGSVQPRATLPNQPPRTLDKLVQLQAANVGTIPMEPALQKICDRALRAPRVPIASYAHDEAQPVFSDLLELDGFLEMLLRVSDVIFADGGSVAGDFEDFIERYIAPLGVRVLHEQEHALETVKAESACIHKVAVLGRTDSGMVSFERGLKKLFDHYCKQGLGHEMGGKFASKKKLSVCQFLMLAKDCKMSNHGISFSICLDTFVTVNQDEVDDFLRGELPYAYLSDMLQMDFQEFQLALDLMVPKQVGLKEAEMQLPREVQLKAFIKKILKNAPGTIKFTRE